MDTQSPCSLEALNERLERLSEQHSTPLISEARRQKVLHKFKDKSLSELNEIAHQLLVHPL